MKKFVSKSGLLYVPKSKSLAGRSFHTQTAKLNKVKTERGQGQRGRVPFLTASQCFLIGQPETTLPYLENMYDNT